MFKPSAKFAFFALLAVNCTVNLEANSIKEVVEHTMTNNPNIISTIKNNEAYRLYIDEAKGGYLPKIDLTAYLGTKSTRTNPDVGANTKESASGPNIQLDFEQLLIDGGLVSGQIDEAKFRYNSNKYLNESIVDDIIYNSVDSYLNLVKYKDRLSVAKESIDIYNDYYITAKETEEISGEGLHKSQVNAKIHLANNNMYRDTNNHLSAVSSFKKNVGMEPDGKSCRPNLDESILPKTMSGLIEQVLIKNPLILEQVENIKEQRAILNQKDASMYPTLKFKAQGIYDRDLETENQRTRIYTARLELSYNIFNGGSDKATTMREKLFLEEAQKKLDSVTNDVIDETTNAYNTYMYAKKRESELKKYIEDNREILSFYKDQFEGGTRTFIDVLNIERDLIGAKENLVDINYDIDSSYFKIFNNLGMIKQSIINSNNESCIETKTIKKESSQQELLERIETIEEVKTVLSENNTVYALYIAAYRNLKYAEKDAEKVRGLLDSEQKVKIETKKGFNSIVIYDIPSKDEVLSIKKQLESKFPGSYIRTFNR